MIKHLVLAVLFTAGSSFGLQVGDLAPDFSAESTSGSIAKLSEFRGSWVVLYFYPKSFTPGCTKEACALRDSYAAIQKSGAVALGASLDSLETQKAFKAKYNLPFELLSDTNKTVAAAYDALGMGGLVAQRKTFIINPAGRIAAILDHVNPMTHDADVRDALLRLQTK